MEIQQIKESIMHPNKPKLGIGFFFLSLSVLVSLITTVVSFLNLVFATLDVKFPDVLNASYQYGYSTYQYDGIRSALATLIIFFPVFLIVSYFWNKLYKKGVGHIDEIIRKWMMYIILFLSAVAVVVDLVTLVRYFVAGEITNRFVYKVLATLLVAIFVGAYYILVLMNKEKIWKFDINLWSALKATIWFVLVVWFAFSVMGSPSKQRLLRFDERRLGDLQSIQWQVISYFQTKQKLPNNLKEVNDPLSGSTLPVDPEFEKGINYEYRLITQYDDTLYKKAKTDEAKKLLQPSFELCATFALPIPKGWVEYQNNYGGLPYTTGVYPTKDIAISSSPEYRGGINESWEHEAGKSCFTRTIDPVNYPAYPVPKPY